MSGGEKSLLTSAYTEALAKGHAYLNVSPDPRLLALPDPFDPDANRAFRLLDASLYQGKFYLYYGVVPFATLMVPWRWVTGAVLADSYAIAFFVAGAMTCFTLLIWDASCKYFPRIGPWLLVAGIMAVTVGSGALQLIRYPRIYELAIAGAWFFESIGLLALYAALHAKSEKVSWLALANLGAALAVGSRPSHIVMALPIAVFTATFLYRTQTRSGWVRPLCLALLPSAAIGAFLAYFNFIRFGSPFDFGYRYLLLDVRNFAADFSHVRYLKFNLWQYIVGLPRWTGWFPFFEQPAPGLFKRPEGYYGLEQAYGMLVTAPLALYSVSLFVFRKRLPETLRPFLILVLTCGLANLLFVSTMNGAVYRYTVDFLPYLLLIGLFQLWTGVSSETAFGNRRIFAFAAFSVSCITALSSFCVAAALYDLTAEQNPAAFLEISKFFNAPRFLFERLTKKPFQKFDLQVNLPSDKYGQVQPLLVTGRPGLQDFLYLYYPTRDKLQIGFEAIGRGGPVSNEIPVEYAKPVHIEIVWGPDLPPPGASQYKGLVDREVLFLRRTLYVAVNGVPVLDCWVDFHLTKAEYHWGESPDNNAFGSKFTGELAVKKRSLKILPVLDPLKNATFGPIILKVMVSPKIVPGREPLVSIGYKNRYQLLTISQRDGKKAVFEVEGTGSSRITAFAPFAANREHTIIFSTGSLIYAVQQTRGKISSFENGPSDNHASLLVDGSEILSGELSKIEVGPTSFVLGRNAVLAAGVSERFSGELHPIP